PSTAALAAPSAAPGSTAGSRSRTRCIIADLTTRPFDQPPPASWAPAAGQERPAPAGNDLPRRPGTRGARQQPAPAGPIPHSTAKEVTPMGSCRRRPRQLAPGRTPAAVVATVLIFGLGCSAGSLPAMAQQDLAPAAALERLFAADSLSADWFAPNFLTQVP